MKYIIGVLVLVLGLFALGAFLRSSDPDVVAPHGLHWHAHLSMLAGGNPVVIPAGIGLAPGEQPLHTHKTDGIIHMEFNGVARKSDLRLGNFFAEWGKPIGSFGRNMRMTVNGATSTAHDNYQMHDGDDIVLSYD